MISLRDMMPHPVILQAENSKLRLFQVTSSWKIIEYVYSQTLRRLTFSCLLIDTLIFLTGFYPNCHLSIPKWGPFKRKLFDKLDCTCRMLLMLLLLWPCIRWASKVLKLKFSSSNVSLWSLNRSSLLETRLLSLGINDNG